MIEKLTLLYVIICLSGIKLDALKNGHTVFDIRMSPWNVFLTESSNSGVLLDENYILTSAQCEQHNMHHPKSVQYGTHEFRTISDYKSDYMQNRDVETLSFILNSSLPNLFLRNNVKCISIS